jgi:hypothetical protein
MSRWLRSQKAFSLFRYAAWGVVCMGLFMAFMLTPWFSQIAGMPRGELLLRILGGTLGVLGAPASLVLWFGMLAFCVREDDSPTSTKIFWFVVFFVFAFFGAAVYFFSVYRKQVQPEGYVSIGAR